MSLLNPSSGIVVTSSSALLSGIAILFTNEYVSKLKTRYTKLKDWINVISLLCEKTLKISTVDEKIGEKEAEELKKVYNHYPEKEKKL